MAYRSSRQHDSRAEDVPVRLQAGGSGVAVRVVRHDSGPRQAPVPQPAPPPPPPAPAAAGGRVVRRETREPLHPTRVTVAESAQPATAAELHALYEELQSVHVDPHRRQGLLRKLDHAMAKATTSAPAAPQPAASNEDQLREKYVHNLQQQIYFLELETNMLRQAAAKHKSCSCGHAHGHGHGHASGGASGGGGGGGALDHDVFLASDVSAVHPTAPISPRPGSAEDGMDGADFNSALSLLQARHAALEQRYRSETSANATRIAQLTQELEGMHRLFSGLQADREADLAQWTALQQELTGQIRAAAQLQLTAEERCSSLTQTLTSERAAMAQVKSRVQDAIKDAVTEAANWRAEFSAAKQQQQGLEAALDAARTELGSTAAQLAEARTELASNKEVISALEGKVKDLTAEARGCSLKISDLEAQLAQVTAAQNAGEEALAQRAEQIASLQAIKRELDQRVANALRRLETEAVSRSELSGQVMKVQEDLDNAKLRITELTTTLQSCRAESLELRQQLSLATAQVSIFRSTSGDAEADAAGWVCGVDHDQLAAENVELRSTLAGLEAALATQGATVSQLRQHCAVHEQALAEYEARLAEASATAAGPDLSALLALNIDNVMNSNLQVAAAIQQVLNARGSAPAASSE